MFKNMILAAMVVLVGAGQAFGQRPANPPIQHIAQVGIQAWKRDAKGVDVGSEGIYSVQGVAGDPKMSKGSKLKAVGTGVLQVFAAGLTVRGGVDAVMPVTVPDAKTKIIIGGEQIGLILRFYVPSAHPGVVFNLVRLDSKSGAFEIRQDEKTQRLVPVAECDLSDRVKMDTAYDGDLMLRFVGSLEPGRYAVVSLSNTYFACWGFEVSAEGVTPQAY